MLRKADQARAVLSVSHISWSGKIKGENGALSEIRDEKKVLDCLRKALKTADKCLEAFVRMQLWIEILEKVHYYQSEGLENDAIKELAAAVLEKTDGQTMDDGSNDAKVVIQHLAKIKAKLNGEEVAPDESPVQSDEPAQSPTQPKVAEVALKEEKSKPVEEQEELAEKLQEEATVRDANDLGTAMNL